MSWFKKDDKKEEKKTTTVINQTTVINKHTTVVMPAKKEEKPQTTTPQPTTKNRYEGLLVCLDPGHAVSTPGKKSPYTLNGCQPALDFCEYKFNRLIVNRLADMLKGYGIEVFITTTEAQDKDTDVKLSERATRAWNKIKASNKKGLFLSIHANANGKGSTWDNAKGWSAYTTKGDNISDKFADCLYDWAEKIFKPKGYTIRTDKQDNDRDWEENFTVIYKTEELSKKSGKVSVPAVLTENFFYTNINDTQYILSEQGMEDVAQVHLNAILQYAEKYYKM